MNDMSSYCGRYSCFYFERRIQETFVGRCSLVAAVQKKWPSSDSVNYRCLFY